MMTPERDFTGETLRGNIDPPSVLGYPNCIVMAYFLAALDLCEELTDFGAQFQWYDDVDAPADCFLR